jgi:intraflagellar transport protein 81
MMDQDIDEQIVMLLKNNMQINFTLVQFSDLANKDLLDLLETVIHTISSDQPEKIGTEKIENTVDRISEFLRVLKFEFPVPPDEWDRRFAEADQALIHPALLFLLHDMDEMKKRAYLAKYMEEDHVPEEIAVDPTVQEMMTQLRELREQFEVVHNEYEELGATNVEELKATKSDLETDKARLANKINSFKRKLQNTKNLSELLQLTGKLRGESERELKLNEQIERLNDEKRLLMHRQQVSSERIKNMRSHLEQNLQARRQELSQLKSMSSGSGGKDEDKGLLFTQQQVIAIGKRKEQREQQLRDIQEKRVSLEKRLQEKQAQGIIEIPPQAQYTQYVEKLRNQNSTFKGLQSQINVYRREIAVMARTKEIVEEQQVKIHDEIERVERQKGIHGFRDARNRLEQISATKADLDDAKGRSLEEMSQIVQEIQRNIKSRQDELKPFVAALQEKRKEKAAVENKYLQAKQRYNSAVSEYDTKCQDLDNECKKLRADISQYQSKFFTVQALLGQQARTTKRINDEQLANESGNPISSSIKTYADYFQKETLAMRKRTKELKEQKKAIGGQSEENQKQLEAFQSLRRLLQVKLQCQRQVQQDKEQQRKVDEEEAHKTDQRIVIE